MSTSRGRPTSANSKNPNVRAPTSAAASEMITFTGVPVSVRSDPACAANASGISRRDGAIRARTATTTTSGSSAATAPLMLMKAVMTATTSETTTVMRRRRVPASRVT